MREKHDDIYLLFPDPDDAFIDDNDIRQSTLNLSDNVADDEPKNMDTDTKRDKRTTTVNDGFILPKKRPRQNSKKTNDKDGSRSNARRQDDGRYY